MLIECWSSEKAIIAASGIGHIIHDLVFEAMPPSCAHDFIIVNTTGHCSVLVFFLRIASHNQPNFFSQDPL